MRRGLRIHRLGADRDVGVRVLVRPNELRVIHPIQVIAREDEIEVGFVLRDVSHRLPDGVGRSLIPVRVVRCLLGGKDLDEPAGEPVQLVGVVDVAIERRGIELGEHEDAPDVGVQAPADRHVNEAVLAANRDRRLRPCCGERKQARSLAATEDDGKRVTEHGDRLTVACG